MAAKNWRPNSVSRLHLAADGMLEHLSLTGPYLSSRLGADARVDLLQAYGTAEGPTLRSPKIMKQHRLPGLLTDRAVLCSLAPIKTTTLLYPFLSKLQPALIPTAWYMGQGSPAMSSPCPSTPERPITPNQGAWLLERSITYVVHAWRLDESWIWSTSSMLPLM